jgi:hypothetical protein
MMNGVKALQVSRHLSLFFRKTFNPLESFLPSPKKWRFSAARHEKAASSIC